MPVNLGTGTRARPLPPPREPWSFVGLITCCLGKDLGEGTRQRSDEGTKRVEVEKVGLLKRERAKRATSSYREGNEEDV